VREDFLHYLWKHKKFAFAKACTTSNHPIHIQRVGQHNHLAGPDFFNAQIEINNQQWAGNVEIHIKSSDWYAHHHETDAAYDSVILHVVWEHDIDIFRKDKTAIPTLVLKDLVNKTQLDSYKKLFAHQNTAWINCENDLPEVPDVTFDFWLDRLYLERLAHKTERIKPILDHKNGDWEATLFVLLLRSFGTKVNADAFQSLGERLDFTIVRKCAQQPFQLEALLYGMSGILPEASTDSYAMQLQAEYEYLAHKFNCSTKGVLPIQFFKLRPPNFPTIRLSQVAQLYVSHQNLFQKLMEVQSVAEVYAIFKIQASSYWDTHYNFDGKAQTKRAKKVSTSFIDLLIINTLVPLQFYYKKHLGQEIDESFFKWVAAVAPEKNTIVSGFNALRPKASNALQTQSLIELKTNYCDPNLCLQCAVGNWLLKQ